jgi:hypothetical protein
VSRRGDTRLLDYSFVPVPQRALQALRAGRLSADELAILAFLYWRARWGALRERRVAVSMTLAQLAEGVGFRGPLDTLGKRLRRLRAKPESWFTYSITGPDRYELTLHSEAPEPSAECPGSDDAPRPPRRSGLESSASTNRAIAETSPSEDTETPGPLPRPGSPVDRPRSEISEERTAKALTPDGPSEPVRDPQTYQKDTSASTKGAGYRDALDEETPWIPEIRAAIEKAHERDRMAEAQELVDSGEASWAEGQTRSAQLAPGSDSPVDPEAELDSEHTEAEQIRRRIEAELGEELDA